NLARNKKTAKRALADRTLITIPDTMLAHGYRCTITSLSPSDKQTQMFMTDLVGLMPDPRKSETRCIVRKPNNLAVAIWLSVGPVSLLLGADLEETSDPETGWSIVLNSTGRPNGKASVFKIPHHGSANGHCADVWTQMLLPKPIAILTPYDNGRTKLPKSS